MRVILAAVGGLKTAGVAEAVSEYENRLRHYLRFETAEIRPAGLPDARAHDAREIEGEALLRAVPGDFVVVALTRTGRRWSTRTLAERMDRARTYGEPGLAFLIGGAHGLGEAVLARASERLSLSEMTLPHELARLVLTEQLYRAATILRGEPYHKGP